MHDPLTNAHRLLQFFELMRSNRPGTAFVRLNQLNLSFSHMRALHLLASGRTLAMKDLAEQLYLSPPSVTALTRRLVQTGLVRRQAHAEDSRIVLLSLTDEGQTLLQQLYQDQLQRMEQLLQALAPEEQEQFLTLLERAVQSMQASVPAVSSHLL
jgi:DNA-binding MarR family transcriptional regulator